MHEQATTFTRPNLDQGRLQAGLIIPSLVDPAAPRQHLSTAAAKNIVITIKSGCVRWREVGVYTHTQTRGVLWQIGLARKPHGAFRSSRAYGLG